MTERDDETDLHIDQPGLFRIFRHAVHGMCLEAMVPWVAWYGIAIRMNAEEIALFEAKDWVELRYQADRLRAWPDRFEDRLVRHPKPPRR